LFRPGNRLMTKFRPALEWLADKVSLLTPLQAALVIAALSFTVKLGYIFLLGGGLGAFPTEGTDAAFYDAAARNLLATGIYGNIPGQPTTGMPPGQSYFLALLYLAGGDSIAFAKLAHVTLLTLVAVLAYFTARELVSASIGFWAGMLAAVDPSLAYLSGTFLSDGLFIFLMIFGIYLLASRLVRPSAPDLKTSPQIARTNTEADFVKLGGIRGAFHFSPRPGSIENAAWLVAAGICFGLAGLTRNQGWFFSIALWLGALVTLGRLLPIRAGTIVLLATVVTIVPWTWRNYQVTGEFIPVSSEGGLTLWSGNNPQFVWRQPMPMSRGIYDAPPSLSGPQVDAYYRQRAIQWITSHPLDFAINGLRKVIVLYSFDPLSWRPEVAGFYRLAGLLPYGILLPFILLGLVLNLNNHKLGIILWYILFTTLMAAVFYGDSRIRAPIQPYLYIFGVLGVERAVSGWRRRSRRAAPALDIARG
jgi:4-amino-4-deoxy-L-arabinose transferase-like glycosyltransferase